jgi:excisionase family DNA binding protein
MEQSRMNLNVMEKNKTMQETITKNKLAYSVDEISEQSTLSKAFLRNEIRAGNLKVKRCGRRVLILKDDFMNYLNGENKDEK